MVQRLICLNIVNWFGTRISSNQNVLIQKPSIFMWLSSFKTKMENIIIMNLEIKSSTHYCAQEISIIFEFKNDKSGLIHHLKILTLSSHFFDIFRGLFNLHMHSEINQIGFRKNMVYGTSMEVLQMVPWCITGKPTDSATSFISETDSTSAHLDWCWLVKLFHKSSLTYSIPNWYFEIYFNRIITTINRLKERRREGILFFLGDSKRRVSPGQKQWNLHGGSLKYPYLIPSLSTSVSLLYLSCIPTYISQNFTPTLKAFTYPCKNFLEKLGKHCMISIVRLEILLIFSEILTVFVCLKKHDQEFIHMKLRDQAHIECLSVETIIEVSHQLVWAFKEKNCSNMPLHLEVFISIILFHFLLESGFFHILIDHDFIKFDIWFPFMSYVYLQKITSTIQSYPLLPSFFNHFLKESELIAERRPEWSEKKTKKNKKERMKEWTEKRRAKRVYRQELGTKEEKKKDGQEDLMMVFNEFVMLLKILMDVTESVISTLPVAGESCPSEIGNKGSMDSVRFESDEMVAALVRVSCWLVQYFSLNFLSSKLSCAINSQSSMKCAFNQVPLWNESTRGFNSASEIGSPKREQIINVYIEKTVCIFYFKHEFQILSPLDVFSDFLHLPPVRETRLNRVSCERYGKTNVSFRMGVRGVEEGQHSVNPNSSSVGISTLPFILLPFVFHFS
ncbi:hypothetical protein VP01_1733g2 [Puccinia sorghi]|uniref:Uncharacterized protein n=1 Tax=Puccinia sorghi TaxID=27349 RepID=A0A0L6VFC3_9BASI|nr:hypothetical protein VP01_1733g2 [Puccinia sorghi]